RPGAQATGILRPARPRRFPAPGGKGRPACGARSGRCRRGAGSGTSRARQRWTTGEAIPRSARTAATRRAPAQARSWSSGAWHRSGAGEDAPWEGPTGHAAFSIIPDARASPLPLAQAGADGVSRRACGHPVGVNRRPTARGRSPPPPLCAALLRLSEELRDAADALFEVSVAHRVRQPEVAVGAEGLAGDDRDLGLFEDEGGQ